MAARILIEAGPPVLMVAGWNSELEDPTARREILRKITEGPPYAFETRKGKRYVTKQYVCTTDNGKTRACLA
jgi:hypothetical protein